MSQFVNIKKDFSPDTNFWNLNPQLTMFKPYYYLYKYDKSANKEISSKQMWMIVFLCDPDPDVNKFFRIPYEQRLKMLKETFYSDFDEDDSTIQKCLEAYPQNMLSAVERALKEEIDSMVERSKWIREYSYQNNSLDDNKKFDQIRKLTTDLYKRYEDLENKFIKEKEQSRVRGGRRESKAEQKLL